MADGLESDAPSTQLADHRPQFDSILRIALPVNVPQRVPKKSRDELIQMNTFSPAAIQNGLYAMNARVKSSIAKGSSIITLDDRIMPTPLDTSGTSMDQDAEILTKIKDLSTLAFSSRRAGKRDVEATAYLSLGVIYDNQKNYLMGIDNYKRYLEICEDLGDVCGCALASNCLGVNFMMLSSPVSDAGVVQGVLHGPQVEEYLNNAIYYHCKHIEIGPDAGGRFVGNANAGLCYAMIGDIVSSAKHQQDALRIAIKMQTLYGQSIAVGNLGMLALLKDDCSTAKTCFEQHLQLVQSLADPEAEVNAWVMLAKVCSSQRAFSESLEHLEQARKIAEKHRFRNELRRIHCLMGVSRATIDFGDYTAQLLDFVQSEANAV
jgi:tetratricopeptide (TPR) repeat protein